MNDDKESAVSQPLHRGDPLAAQRADDGPALDVLLAGELFFDIIFTDLPEAPAPGTEVWAGGMGSCPGGIANLAVAASRLGLRTGLATGFGDDAYGRWSWDVLHRQEGIDLSCSRRLHGHSSVTVSLARLGDRAMVTHGHPLPLSDDELIVDPPPTRAVLTDVPPAGRPLPAWWRTAAARGSLVFADVGWDPTGRWDPAALEALALCHAFTPNQVEAMAYTRTDSPRAALHALAGRVPLAVVTCGPDGALGVDAGTGEFVHVPPVPVVALDATGAGDVFGAALVVGTLAGWPLADRLAFAAMCSALAVQQFGGSLAAPGWGDIADWWHRVRDDGDRDLVARYAFLDGVLPAGPLSAVRRAEATLTLYSDLQPDESDDR